MSALTDYIIGRPGCIGCWPLDDAAASTTIADLGTNTLTGTELNVGVSRAAMGATGFVTGHSLCWQGSTVARGFQVATAANVTTQLQTYSIGIFAMPTVTATAGAQLIGRQNGWQIAATTARANSATSGLAGVPLRFNPTAMSLNTGHLMGYSYDGQELQPWMDGERDGIYSRYAATLASWPNRVAIGGDTGAANNGWKLSVGFIFSRALLPGEWAQIYRLGLGERTTDHAAAFDFTGDAAIPVLATQAEGTPCYACGGRRRAGQGGVSQSSPARVFCAVCFGAQAKYKQTAWAAPTNTNTDRELDAYTMRLCEAVCDAYAKRPTTDSKWWLAASGQLSGSGIQTQNYGGQIATLGILHRMQGSAPHSTFLQRIKLMMAYLKANQIPAGQTFAGYFSTDGTPTGDFGVNGVFTARDLLIGLLAVRKDVDSTTLGLWLATMRKFGDANWLRETSGSARYWSNGNIVMNHWGIFRMLAKFDTANAAKWQAYADAYLAFLFSPSGGASGYVGGTLTGVGTRRFVDGTPGNDPLISLATMRGLNVASDKIYSTEGSGSAAAPGTTYLTTFGFDQNYCLEQSSIATNIYLATGDTDAWKLAQLYANTAWPYQNLTGGTVTGPTGASVSAWYSDNHGTRHNASELAHIYLGHTLRRLGRTDYMTAQQVADHHVFIEGDALLNTTQQNVWYRSTREVALSLCASPYWPGIPAA